MHKKRQRRLVFCAGIVAATAIALTACTAGPGAESSKRATTAAGTDVPAAALSSAHSLIQKYSGKPTFTAPGPAVDASKVAGKSLLVVDMDQVAQVLITANAGITAASDAAGLKTTFFNGQDTASTLQQGVQQGITQKVDAILLVGVPAVLIPSAIADADSAGIPVIAVETGIPQPSGIYGSSSPDFQLLGQLIGAGAITEANGQKVVAGLLQFTNPVAPQMVDGINGTFDTCNGSCTIAKTNTIEPSNWPTQVPPATSAIVAANPDVNTILALDDTLGQFAASGVKSSGSSTVKVIGASGSGQAPLSVVASGGSYAADPGQPALWVGWGAVDQAMRAMLKMAPGQDVAPLRYLDSGSLSGVDLSDQNSIYGDAYVDGFKALWGLS